MFRRKTGLCPRPPVAPVGPGASSTSRGIPAPSRFCARPSPRLQPPPRLFKASHQPALPRAPFDQPSLVASIQSLFVSALVHLAFVLTSARAHFSNDDYPAADPGPLPPPNARPAVTPWPFARFRRSTAFARTSPPTQTLVPRFSRHFGCARPRAGTLSFAPLRPVHGPARPKV